MTADMALWLGRLYGNTAEFWMKLQLSYDLTVADDQQAATLTAIEPLSVSKAA